MNSPCTEPKDRSLEYEKTKSYKSFSSSERFCYKHVSYFQVYDRLFSRFVGKEIIFVEVGVLGGGSLQMWRDFLGEKARIIGVEFHPGAKELEKEGFEIHIGDQADPKFWADFFAKIGKVDIVLDDGGHTFEQQIITADSVLPHIKDDGMLVTEDVQTSYMRLFGGPSRHSFVSYACNKIHGINYRYGKFASKKYREGIVLRRRVHTDNLVYSISFFQSIIAFHVDRQLAMYSSSEIANINDKDLLKEMDDQSYTYHSDIWVQRFGRWFSRISNFLKNQFLGKYFRH
ncbi:MAG: class I SAM-dependent methyltransferase [Gammaproteobacteria bacterium]|nr:class I SAM-dependent methyltransferase [Gammaproteobacteria bacterium]